MGIGVCVLMRRTPTSRELHADDGFVVVAAIIVISLVSMFALSMIMFSTNGAQRSNSRLQHVVSLPPADSARENYLYAVQNGIVEERSSFVLTQAALESLRQPGLGDEVIPNSDPRIPTVAKTLQGVFQDGVKIADVPAFTMKETIRGSSTTVGFWQQYRVDAPSFTFVDSNSNLVVYFRAWVAAPDGSQPTKPRYVRVEYRPGRFADYQILTDGPLAFQSGATLDGPVHSNGLSDNPFLTIPSSNNRLRIWSYGGVNCTSSAYVTTAKGDISMPGCTSQANTGSYISFLRTQDSFNQIENDCNTDATDTVWCFPPITGVYDVTLQGNSIAVAGVGTFPVSRYAAMMFHDDVQIRGRTSGRVTIAVRRNDVALAGNGGRAGAATIRIMDDLGTTLPKARKDALGLLSEGDIIVDMNMSGNKCPVSNINAAMVAMSGSLTIPPEWTTQLPPADAPWCTNPLVIDGSVAVHRAPIMQWIPTIATIDRSNSDRTVGYKSRTYSWDQNLRVNTPPYFPLSDLWQVSSYKEANADCLTSRSGDTTCE
jgi:hypothetical protein